LKVMKDVLEYVIGRAKIPASVIVVEFSVSVLALLSPMMLRRWYRERPSREV